MSGINTSQIQHVRYKYYQGIAIYRTLGTKASMSIKISSPLIIINAS